MSVRQILSKIKCKHLDLCKGEGYWYFVYDDGKMYGTHTVYCYRLNHMTLEQWVEEGLDFIKGKIGHEYR